MVPPSAPNTTSYYSSSYNYDDLWYNTTSSNSTSTDLGYGYNTNTTSSTTYTSSSTPIITTSGTPINNKANVVINAENITVKQGSSFKVLKNIKATDNGGKGKNIKKITAQGKVNTKVPGTYPITYISTGSNGVKVSKTVYVTVK